MGFAQKNDPTLEQNLQANAHMHAHTHRHTHTPLSHCKLITPNPLTPGPYLQSGQTTWAPQGKKEVIHTFLLGPQQELIFGVCFLY